MAFLVMNKIKTRIMQGGLDFRDAGADHRLIPVFTAANTSVDTEDDVEFVGSYTTLGEYDGGARPPAFASRDALVAAAVNEQLPDDRTEFDATDYVFTAISGTGASDTVGGILIYEHITNDAASRGIVYIDAAFTANGGDVTLQFNSEGILQLS